MRILVSGIAGAFAGGIVATVVLVSLSVVLFWPTENMAATFGLVVGPILGGTIGGLIGALLAIRPPTHFPPKQ